MNFELDEQYFTSVTIYKEWSVYDGKENLTSQELLDVLQGKGKCSSTSSADHPEFAKLRETLGEQGYISIQRSWWNGDTVIKPFKLNNKRFKKGDRFLSAAAQGCELSFQKKRLNDSKNTKTT